MSYRRALVLRWSRRDRLAVLVVALTVAFLVGTTLLVLAAGSQTAAIAAEYGSSGAVEYYEDVQAARESAPAEAAVLPVATAERSDGRHVRIVARTAEGHRLARDQGFRLYGADEGVTSGLVRGTRTVRLDGEAGGVSVDVRRRGETVLDPAWYVAPPSLVESLGTTGAVAVRPTGDSIPRSGVPLLSALAFFVAGTREALRALSVAALGGGLLVGVTVYSVVRMTVRDRVATLRIVRATGAPPRRVLSVFAVRGALLAGTGAALGYAVGVIVPNVAVNAAVYVGLPTSLAVEVTPRATRVLVPVVGATVGVGALAGVLAAVPAVRSPPGQLRGNGEGRRGDRSLLSPRLLDWRALVPTAATLTAFVIFATLVVAMAGAIAPLASADGATITEPGATHPVASQVPASYASVLRSWGVDASPEILAFAVSDGQPFVVRGVNASAFARVSDADLTRGRYPDDRSEALVGADLARTLGADVGDQLLVGGSTKPAVTEVRVVGVVRAPGAHDDQLLVSLPTARHLANVAPGQVQFVRTARVPDLPDDRRADGVVAIDAPGRVTANATLPVTVTVRNAGVSERTTTVEAVFRGVERTRKVTLAPGTQGTLSVEFPAGSPGSYTLRVGNTTRRVEVVSPDAIEILGLPAEAPPGSEPRIEVRTLGGDPVGNATVTIDGRTVRTAADGTARVPLEEVGRRTVRVRRGSHTDVATVTVVEGARRTLSGSLTIHPSSPNFLTAPEARLVLSNRWNRTLSATVRVELPGGTRTHAVDLAPGEEASITLGLPRRPPGTYTVRVTNDGRVVAETTYEVAGDERVAAAIAEGSANGGSGIQRAIETAFGNLELLLGVIVGLAGLMTAGGTTASFARAVHARKRTIGIYRATGASPGEVLAIVLRDTLLIGAAASGLALPAGIAVLVGFEAVGLLAPFGIRLPAIPDPAVALGIGIGALLIALVGATLATLGHLLSTPAALIAGEQGPSSREWSAASEGGEAGD